jgi:hypothetical protein
MAWRVGSGRAARLIGRGLTQRLPTHPAEP